MIPVQQGQLNPAQIALAAARNLGVPSALPSQAVGQALGGYQANPQLLAQLMRPQQQNVGQCERLCAGLWGAIAIENEAWLGRCGEEDSWESSSSP